MVFIDGSLKQLKEVSQLIEDETAKGKSSVDLSEDQKKFIESIVSMSISTNATRAVTLHAGAQSSTAIPLPAVMDNATSETLRKARLILTMGNGKNDLGDVDNTVLPDVVSVNKYSAMHQFAHALKLNHKDSMFYAPEETKRFEALQALPLKGMVAAKDLPSLQPTEVDVTPMAQQRGSYQGRSGDNTYKYINNYATASGYAR